MAWVSTLALVLMACQTPNPELDAHTIEAIRDSVISLQVLEQMEARDTIAVVVVIKKDAKYGSVSLGEVTVPVAVKPGR